MKRFFGALIVLLLALCGVLVARTMQVPPPIPAALASESGAVVLDTVAAGERLARAVSFPTVSLASGAPIDSGAFRGLHQHLEMAFPQVHANLTRELIAGLSLLYTWPGTDSTLPPVVLMGHLDVVPVPEANLGEWTHGPFSGDIADGYVWGRGTLDDKVTVLAILQAAEVLLASGFKPARTLYLAFGHDEEVGGRYGARAIVDKLVRQGVKPALVLDEGGFMAAGLMPGLPGRAAIVGIAEKGYLSLKLTARAEGGHSSMPTGRTAIGALSRAISRLESEQFPLKLEGPTRGMVEAMAPYMPFSRRLMIANLWLTAPLVRRTLAANPLGAALQHTTTSPTMLSAGIKDNVLPPEASAVVNFRIVPGETKESVIERVTEIVADSQVSVAMLDSTGVDPSPVSDVTSPAYQLLAETIRGMVPNEQIPVIPYLVMGGTDAKYWGAHSDRVFRFLPVPLGATDRARVHGVNERVALADYATSVNFFARFVRNLDKLDTP